MFIHIKLFSLTSFTISLFLLLFPFFAKDTYWNPDEFPRSFFKGTWEGFWWAFVSMTTVG